MDNFANFARSSLASGIALGDTSLAVATGDGARFPVPRFSLTVWNLTDYSDPSDDPDREIVLVTAVAGDTFTVIRGEEGTAAANHNAPGKTYGCVNALTAKALVRIGGVRGQKVVTGILYSSAPFTIDLASLTLGDGEWASGRFDVAVGAFSSDRPSLAAESHAALFGAARTGSSEIVNFSDTLVRVESSTSPEGIEFDVSITITSHVVTFAVVASIDTPFTIDTATIEFALHDASGHQITLH